MSYGSSMQAQTTFGHYTMPRAMSTRFGVFEVPTELTSLVDELDSSIANDIRASDSFRADLQRRILADVLQRHGRSIETARSA
jgi:hypothetical protein